MDPYSKQKIIRNPIKLSEFSGSSSVSANNVITAVSYEERGYESLTRILARFRIKKIIMIQFNVETYLDGQTLQKWKIELSRTLLLLQNSGCDYQILHSKHDDFGSVFDEIRDCMADEAASPDIVDITTLPKNYILRIAKEFDSGNTLFMYTRGQIHQLPTPAEQLASISKIIPIDGFAGVVDLRAEDLLVLVLGYEGNRAFAFLSDFPSERVLALIGVPRLGAELDRNYIKNAEESNRFLLNNSSVVRRDVNSYNHWQFCSDLKTAISEQIKERNFNISISPIGTKAQALGLYLYWREHKETQILYSIPSQRTYLASGIGDSWIYQL